MIYLDNAATTLCKPKEVSLAMVKALETVGNSGRGVHEYALNAARTVFETRLRLATLFGAESPEQIAFTMNATQALNTAIKGILKPGDHVITTVLEHNSVLRPLYEMEEKGVELSIVDCNGKGNIAIEDIEKEIRENTKAIVCTHASNLTGNVVDIAEIGKTAHKKGIVFIVDASQTAGIFPIDVKEMYIDVLCFTGHKGLMGPQGTGGLYVNKEVEINPILSGGSGVMSFQKKHPEVMPTKLEAGTLNVHGLAGLNAALQYILEQGVEEIKEKEIMLTKAFYQEISSIPGIEIYGDFSKEDRCPIVACNLRERDSAWVADRLAQEYDIAVRAGAHCAPLMHQALHTSGKGAVRFSFSQFNTMEEIKMAAKALKELSSAEG